MPSMALALTTWGGAVIYMPADAVIKEDGRDIWRNQILMDKLKASMQS